MPVTVCWWASVLWPPAVQDLGVPGPGCLDIWKEIPELCLSLSLFSTADKSPGNRSGASKIFGTCWSQQLSLEFPGRFFAQLPVLAAGGDTHPCSCQPFCRQSILWSPQRQTKKKTSTTVISCRLCFFIKLALVFGFSFITQGAAPQGVAVVSVPSLARCSTTRTSSVL